MNYEVSVNIMPHKGLLDPQGKAVHQGLNKIGLNQVHDVRIGKKIVLHVEAASADEARNIAEESCKKVLVNAVMETADISVAELA
ncbi:MAG: phosphoribosylformylglycinamidine synthase [Bacteroidetes bacterium]|nr:MAG: phosphoribosylformylglycinamidine synthase [Bacteroidota bacterium]